MIAAADLKRASDITKHENDIYLIAGRYALVKRINGRKSPMRLTMRGKFRRAARTPCNQGTASFHDFINFY